MSVGIEAPFPHRDHLGEGPHWDTRDGVLRWVDLHTGEVHALDPATGALSSLALEPPVCFAIPDGNGSLMIGGFHTVERVDGQGHRHEVARIGDDPDVRMNDAKCDPAGRLVFGSMSPSRRLGQGALYSLDGVNPLRRLATGVSLSNGLGWDAGGERFYHVDSDAQQITQYDYDISTGDATDPRVFATIDPDDGLPDGMAVDAEGGVWVALFFGGRLRRYSPDGHLDEEVVLPVLCPTSVAFGGPDLDTLFVTTGTYKVGDPDENDDLAGALLVLRPGVKGCPVATFGAVAARDPAPGPAR